MEGKRLSYRRQVRGHSKRIPVSEFPSLKGAEVQRILSKAGCQRMSQRGSHVIFRGVTGAEFTFALHPTKTVAPKILRSLMEKAGLTNEEIRQYLPGRRR